MKKTSRNNQFLKDIKKCYNSKIYSTARKIYLNEGHEKAEEYINQFGNYKEILKILNN